MSWTDITPTLLELAGAKGPSYALHGRSFRPGKHKLLWNIAHQERTKDP